MGRQRRAVQWLEHEALVVDRRRARTAIRPERIEDVIEVVGPRTVELLRHAQVAPAPYNLWIGRWAQ
jgi:hypothetical protein